MGDPKKPKKKYKSPGHPWEAERIKEEGGLRKEYGLTNKKEIWRMNTKLRNWHKQARKIVSLEEEQRKLAEKALVNKLNQLGILEKDAFVDDILALTIRDVLERRLQTQVYKRGLVNSVKQARQFILHNKVVVGNKIVSAPTYLVKTSDAISLIPGFAPIIKKVIELKESEMNKIRPKKSEVKQEAEKTDEEVVEEILIEEELIDG